MNDFLSSLASKGLSVAPIIQPRPMSLFEPWQPGGVLEATPIFDRAETDRTMPGFESDIAGQARLEGPRRESHDPIDEVPRTPALYAAPLPESMPQQPPVTLQTVLMPAPVASQPVKREVPYEIDGPAPIDRSVTTPADITRASSNAVSIVEHIERVIVERGQTDRDRAELDRPARERDTRPIGMPPIASHDAARTPTNGTSIDERVIVERGQADRDHAEPDRPARERDAGPIGVAPITHNDAARASPNTAPVIERIERVIVDHGQSDHNHVEHDHRARERAMPPGFERLPVQPVIVEPERSDRAQAAQSGSIQSVAAMPAPTAPDASRATHSRVTPNVERVERIRGNSDRGQVDRLSTTRAAPPMIHVTIGRIEVRAALPPTPVKRASPPTSTMSLEEYLRSRSGDRR
jgi:hypothetical protein